MQLAKNGTLFRQTHQPNKKEPKNMNYKCLLGHKWNGCICERCGTTRDEQHTWEHIIDKCVEKCAVCGKEHEKHTWVKGKCMTCGLEIKTIKPLATLKLSNLVQVNERGVLVNVFSYALKNWGNPQEEIEIKKLLLKISSDAELTKSDVVLLNRIYSLILRLFPNNTELHIEGMFSLGQIVNNMI